MGIRRQLHITLGFPLTGKKAQRVHAASGEAGSAADADAALIGSN